MTKALVVLLATERGEGMNCCGDWISHISEIFWVAVTTQGTHSWAPCIDTRLPVRFCNAEATTAVAASLHFSARGNLMQRRFSALVGDVLSMVQLYIVLDGVKNPAASC